MAAQLIITEPSGRRRVVPIAKGGEVSIARGTGNDIMVVDRLVSRRHCTVRWTDGGICVEDHNSQNGTFLNSQRITGRRWLRDGDVVQIGNSTIRLVTLWKGEGVTGGVAAPTWVGKALVFVLLLGTGVLAGFHSDFVRYLFPRPGLPAAAGDSDAGRQPRDSNATPAAGTNLAVTSNPPGAMVFINNQYVGVTPVNLACADGLYSVRLELTGYGNFSRAVEIKGDTQAVAATLAPLEASFMRIESDPTDAEVLVDGNKVGRTPITVETGPGSHEVIIQKTNYMPWKGSVEVGAGQTVAVSGRMEHRNIASYLEMLTEDPNNVSYYCQLGHYYILERRFEEARDALRKGMETFCKGQDTSNYAPRMKWLLDKIYFGDYFEVGDEQQHNEMREWIINLYVEMIKTYPAQKSSLTQWLQGILKRAGREGELNKLLQGGNVGAGKPAGGEPNLDIYFQAADIYLAKGRYERAVNILLKAVKLGPNNCQAYLRLGKAYIQWHTKAKANVKEKAVSCLKKALALCKDEKARQEINELLKKAGEN